jgi:hypothetical protein
VLKDLGIRERTILKGRYKCDLRMWTKFRWFGAIVNAVIHLGSTYKMELICATKSFSRDLFQ